MSNMAYWADQEVNDNFPEPGDTWRMAAWNGWNAETVEVHDVRRSAGTVVIRTQRGTLFEVADARFDIEAGAKLLARGDKRLALEFDRDQDKVDDIDANRMSAELFSAARNVHSNVCYAEPFLLLRCYTALLEVYSAASPGDEKVLSDMLLLINKVVWTPNTKRANLLFADCEVLSDGAENIWQKTLLRSAKYINGGSLNALDRWARRLSQTNRATWAYKDMPETVLQHSFTLATLVFLSMDKSLRNFSAYEIATAIAASLLHDLPEAHPDCRDTDTLRPLTEEEQLRKEYREREAAEALYADLEQSGHPLLVELHKRYEAQADFDVRHIRVLDKALPKIAGIQDRARSLLSRGMTFLRLRDCHRVQWRKLQEQYADCPEALSVLLLSYGALEQHAVDVLPLTTEATWK